MPEGNFEHNKVVHVVHNQDDALLATLGYKGEFKRAFSVSICWPNQVMILNLLYVQTLYTVGFAFSIMGVCANVSVTYIFPLTTGMFLLNTGNSVNLPFVAGHLGLTIGWIIPSLFVLCVALSIAELTSSMP